MLFSDMYVFVTFPGSECMNLKTFTDLLKRDLPFESVRLLSHKNFKKKLDEEALEKLLKKMDNMSNYALAELRKENSEALNKEAVNWEFKKEINMSKVEAISDFSEATFNRVKVTVDDYSRYYDRLIADEDSNDADLTMEIYSGDKKKSFKAELLCQKTLIARQQNINTFMPLATLDYNMLCLAQYLMSCDGAESSETISVAEGIARGKAYVTAANALGIFLNKKLMELFNDFF